MSGSDNKKLSRLLCPRMDFDHKASCLHFKQKTCHIQSAFQTSAVLERWQSVTAFLPSPGSTDSTVTKLIRSSNTSTMSASGDRFWNLKEGEIHATRNLYAPSCSTPDVRHPDVHVRPVSSVPRCLTLSRSPLKAGGRNQEVTRREGSELLSVAHPTAAKSASVHV